MAVRMESMAKSAAGSQPCVRKGWSWCASVVLRSARDTPVVAATSCMTNASTTCRPCVTSSGRSTPCTKASCRLAGTPCSTSNRAAMCSSSSCSTVR